MNNEKGLIEVSDKQMIKDILIKAAEDVERGLWCEGAWFDLRPLDTDEMEKPVVDYLYAWYTDDEDDEDGLDEDGKRLWLNDNLMGTDMAPTEVFDMAKQIGDDKLVELLADTKRCAEGSILFATLLLGGKSDDYYHAKEAVERASGLMSAGRVLSDFNDGNLQEKYKGDGKGAGMELGVMFRQAADTIVVKDTP